jgi:outer membrane protein insertion porin family
LRLGGALLRTLGALAVVCAGLPAFGANPGGSAQEQASSSAQPTGAISSYQGLVIQDIRFPQVAGSDGRYRDSIPFKTGDRVTRDGVRESIEKLHDTGRFADIRVEADKTSDGQVVLSFVTVPNYFIGDVTVEGTPNRPSENQVSNVSKLQLGELFTPEKLDRALASIKQLLEENGFHQATVRVEKRPHPENQQIDLNFVIAPGAQARVGQVTVTGKPGFSQGQIQDIAKMHRGDLVTVQRVSNGLDRIRKKYQKQDRLLAQVAIRSRIYHLESNTIDFTIDVNPGPKVLVGVQGFKISQSLIRRSVPVYEENAFDDDLLNEGRRNLLNVLQGKGFFDAKVGLKKHAESSNLLQVVYVIDPGPRHKLVKIILAGNKYFPDDLIRGRMQIAQAERFFSHGRYNQRLLSDDVRNAEDLYHTNGFEQVKVSGTIIDNYGGEEKQLAVKMEIDEGPQTVVGALHIVGNQVISETEYPTLNTSAGQPFSETNIATDRDILLNFYFNHGFPNAAFEASAKPSAEENRMDVTYTVHEGERFFVDQVLLSGLEHTRPYIAERELRVKSGDDLSQLDMLRTQQRLYDLGIFGQVDTAVQNPQGSERQKNVLVDVEEAKRYTFNYGVGLEFQTGQPAGSTQPQGATGVSPRVSFEMTRLNFRGINHTVTFKAHVGRLQQRALISYDAPRWLDTENWRLSLTAFYDNTLDVTTFTSERLEGSVQAQQTISRASTMFYQFNYRRVRASDIEISQDQIPLLSQPVRVGIPGFSYIRDKRDNPLETTRGNYTTIDGGTASSYFGSEADFGRILVQNSTYQLFGKNRPTDRKFVFARSTRIGIEVPFGDTIIAQPGEAIPAANNLIPLAERFFSGGGNSHRGFGLNQAGPRDPITGFPLGGSALFINNLELRLPPPTLPWVQDNLSFAIFHDAGNVFTDGHDMLHSLLQWRQKNSDVCTAMKTRYDCNYNYISHAIGVGVRYKTPIGPVRFDFGYNLNPPKFPETQDITLPNGNKGTLFVPQQASHFNVYFSIGQTF